MTELFLKILNMSIAASWLVLAVLLLRFVLKRAPKWVNVLLWGIVALRLLLPFSIESALSLIPSTETVSPEIMMDWTPEISTGIESLNRLVNPMISASFAPKPYASANPLQILIPIWAILWLAGIAALLIYTAVSYLRLRRRVREAVVLRDNIYQSENVESPFVLGIIRPKIYLPYHMDGQDMEHVVAHEQAHIRRRDHWWKPLGFLLLAVYWFNPLLWLAYVLLCRDIELACDEKVIAELGNAQRADYTQALVSCSVNRRSIAACPLAFGEVGVKARVKSVLHYKKPAFWLIIAAVIVCVAVALCFLTNPAEDADYPDEAVPDKVSFEAELLSVHDGYFLVKPLEGWVLNSADQIEVPMKNMDPSLEPQVGDIIEIVYSGEILETYPARLQEVYSIRVVTQLNAGAAEKWDLIPMIRVNGVCYLDTGHNNPSVADDAAFDGEITSAVDGSERPSADDQSNFGTGYGYRFGEREGTVELYMNGKWRIFATEEVRQEIQFPDRKAAAEEALLEAFRSSISGDETVIVTDCVLVDDGAYGLDGVVQYADETGTPWKLAFIRDGAAFPVSQEWGADYAVASELHYLGDGVVQVYIEKLTDGTYYVCEMAYSYDEATKQTHFKSSSGSYAPPPGAGPVTAVLASEELLAGMDYHEALTNDSEYAVKLLFRANEALTDVYFSALSYEDDGKIGEEKLLSVPELRPDNPLVVSVVFYGDMTAYGISFKDAAGSARRYMAYISGRDGSLILEEY